jgi:spermidine synthase
VLALEALASLGSGLALSLWALPALGVERTLALGGLLLLACAVLAAWWLGRRAAGGALLALLGLAGVASLWGAPETLGEFSRGRRFDDVGQGYRRLRELDSPYQNLVLAAPASAAVAPGQPDSLALAQHPRPRHVLVIGGGLPGAPGEALAHGLTRLDYLDLDPAVLALLAQELPPILRAPLEDPRLRLLPVDARRHLQQTDVRYDLVLVDLPDPGSAMLNRAFTSEFFGELKRALAPGAAVVIRASSVDAYLGEAGTSPTAATFKALCQAFAHCDALPGSEALLLASDDDEVIRVEPAVLAERLRERDLHSAYFSVDELPLLVQAERQRALLRALQQAAVPPNTDARPATYFYNLILLGHHSAPWLARDLHALRGLHPAWLVAALLGPALAAWAWRRRRPAASAGAGRRATLLAIASTGLLGTAESVALVYAFQNRVGVVYTWLAALVGLFMLGLAAGSLLAGHLLAPSTRRPERVLLGAELFNAALALGLGAVLLQSAALPPTTSALAIGGALVLGGLGVGLSFVAASACLGGPAGRVAGLVDAADCAGAAVGALLTGVVGLPVLGAAGLAAVLCALKLAAVLGLVGSGLMGSGLLRAPAPPAA